MPLCTRCKTERDASEFGVDRSRTDGRQPWCFGCKRDYSRARRAAGRGGWDPERYRANPEMFKAHVAVCRALKSGKLVKPSICPSCHVWERKVEGHHYLGYEREHWLTVQWLCRSCHSLTHQGLTLPTVPAPPPRRPRTPAERFDRLLQRIDPQHVRARLNLSRRRF